MPTDQKYFEEIIQKANDKHNQLFDEFYRENGQRLSQLALDPKNHRPLKAVFTKRSSPSHSPHIEYSKKSYFADDEQTITSSTLELLHTESILRSLLPEAPIALSPNNSRILIEMTHNHRLHAESIVAQINKNLQNYLPSIDVTLPHMRSIQIDGQAVTKDMFPIISSQDMRSLCLIDCEYKNVFLSSNEFRNDRRLAYFYSKLGVSYRRENQTNSIRQRRNADINTSKLESSIRAKCGKNVDLFYFGSIATTLNTSTSDCDISISNFVALSPFDFQATPLDKLSTVKVEMWQRLQEDALVAITEILTASRDGIAIPAILRAEYDSAIRQAISVGIRPHLQYDTRSQRLDNYTPLFESTHFLTKMNFRNTISDAELELHQNTYPSRNRHDDSRRYSDRSPSPPTSPVYAALRQIYHILQRVSDVEKITPLTSPRIRVPLVRIKFMNKNENDVQPEIDICLNNNLGVFNSHILRAYVSIDPRVSPLIQAIKSWFIRMELHNAQRSRLSSYAITLFVLFYLQNLRQPLIPCLQGLSGMNIDNKYIFRGDILGSAPGTEFVGYGLQNTMDVHELFAGFFEFYSTFDFENRVISVRTGHGLPVLYKKSQWNKTRRQSNSLVYIEDILDSSHNLSGHLTPDLAETLIGAIRSMVLINDFTKFYSTQYKSANDTLVSMGISTTTIDLIDLASLNDANISKHKITYLNSLSATLKHCHKFMSQLAQWFPQTVHELQNSSDDPYYFDNHPVDRINLLVSQTMDIINNFTVYLHEESLDSPKDLNENLSEIISDPTDNDNNKSLEIEKS